MTTAGCKQLVVSKTQASVLKDAIFARASKAGCEDMHAARGVLEAQVLLQCSVCKGQSWHLGSLTVNKETESRAPLPKSMMQCVKAVHCSVFVGARSQRAGLHCTTDQQSEKMTDMMYHINIVQCTPSTHI